MTPLSCIMLVDDDDTTNYLNKLIVERTGAARKVMVALNGREALNLLHANCDGAAAATCPVLVLLDLKMPVMDGLDFLALFAKLPEALRSSIVVVMLTTSVNAQDVRRMQGLPIAASLTKPLTIEKFTALLQQIFGYSESVE